MNLFLKNTILLSSLILISVSSFSAEVIINWKDKSYAHNDEILKEKTGLNVKLIKSLQSSFDLVNLSGFNTSDSIQILKDTNLFLYVEPNTKIRVPRISLKKPKMLGAQKKNTFSNNETIGTRAVALNKFNDRLYLEQSYLDEQNKGRMGLSNILKARTYAEKNVNLNRKVRIAVLDSGKWNHEDVVWSSDEANFTSNGYYCEDAVDGQDFTCLAENASRAYYNNDSIAKTWVLENESYNIYVQGHGLNMASQIGATSNNSIGIVGIVPSNYLDLIPVKILSYYGANTSDIATGIYWSIGEYDNGNLVSGDKGYVNPISAPVDIINLSLGGDSIFSCESNSIFKSAVEAAYAKNISVVVSAGNEFQDTTYKNLANCSQALVVGSNAISGEISSFSNYGQFVDVSISGEEIDGASISTNEYKSDFGCNNQCYSRSTGTSPSAANISAVLGLLKLTHPDLSVGELEALLLSTSTPYLTDASGNVSKAHQLSPNVGVVDALSAIKNDKSYAIGKQSVHHRFANYTTDYQIDYVNEMKRIIPNVCSMYNMTFGKLQHASQGISYNVLQTSQTGDLNNINFEKSFIVKTPQVIVDLSQYSRVGVQSCKNGTCDPIVEINLSNTISPPACL